VQNSRDTHKFENPQICKFKRSSQIRIFADWRDPHKFEILTNSQILRDPQIRKFANSQIQEILTSTRDPHKCERSHKFANPTDTPTRFPSSKRAPQFAHFVSIPRICAFPLFRGRYQGSLKVVRTFYVAKEPNNLRFSVSISRICAFPLKEPHNSRVL